MIFINEKSQVSTLISELNKNNVPYLILGKGSNVLISDEGFFGVTLVFGENFSKIEFADDNFVTCDAGVGLTFLAKKACEKSLTGLEFAYGIPASVGGAVFMNAGAYGGEISDIIVSVTAVDILGNEKIFAQNELDLSYRHSVFCENDYTIISATFKLETGNSAEIKSKMQELMLKRKEKQPLEFPSAGSTFKRPDGAFAAKLIEDCGLKGVNIGGAKVSEKHSGFVINYNKATFFDVVNLIKHIKKVVLEKTGYNLECEVKIISK